MHAALLLLPILLLHPEVCVSFLGEAEREGGELSTEDRTLHGYRIHLTSRIYIIAIQERH